MRIRDHELNVMSGGWLRCSCGQDVHGYYISKFDPTPERTVEYKLARIEHWLEVLADSRT